MPSCRPLTPEILFEDNLVLAVDKPSGLAMAPREAAGRPSLRTWLFDRWGRGIAPAHRLDVEASGVVLCAKTKASLDFMSGQFQSKTARRVHRVLVAVVEHPPFAALAALARDAGGALRPEFAVDAPLSDEGPGPVRIARGRNSRPSITDFRILESFGAFAWIECRPLTGCRHQVRAHLAAVGAPVLNDATYGPDAPQLLLSDLKRGYKGRDEERPLLSRLAFHGAEVEFVHPGLRAAQRIAAPLPPEFEIALKYLRRFSRVKRADR